MKSDEKRKERKKLEAVVVSIGGKSSHRCVAFESMLAAAGPAQVRALRALTEIS